MAEAGASLLYPLVNLAVMWFLNVFLNLVTFIRLIFMADRHFRDERPDAVVLVDYPGPALVDRPPRQGAGHPGLLLRSSADLGVGRLARQEGAEVRRPGLVQPAVRAGVVSRARRADGGLRRSSVLRRAGGPAAGRELPGGPSDRGPGQLVAILPGSRTQEVVRNLPEMVRAANKLARQRPAFASPSPACTSATRRWPRQIVAQSIAERRRCSPGWRSRSTPGRTPELIRLARVAWAVSGSVGLELMVEALALGRALQDQAIRSLGGAVVHQVEVHQPGQSSGRRRGVSRVLDVARRLGRAGPMGAVVARRFRRRAPRRERRSRPCDTTSRGRAHPTARPSASFDWLDQNRRTRCGRPRQKDPRDHPTSLARERRASAVEPSRGRTDRPARAETSTWQVSVQA